MCGRGSGGRGGLVCCVGSLHTGRRGGGSKGTGRGKERGWRKGEQRRRRTTGGEGWQSDSQAVRQTQTDVWSRAIKENARFYRILENEKQWEFWWVAESPGWGQSAVSPAKIWMCFSLKGSQNDDWACQRSVTCSVDKHTWITDSRQTLRAHLEMLAELTGGKWKVFWFSNVKNCSRGFSGKATITTLAQSTDFFVQVTLKPLHSKEGRQSWF